MPLFGNKNKENRNDKKEDREQKTNSRRAYRIEKIKALTAKAYAVATKRKWLVYLLGLGIIIYFIFSSGGFSGLGGMLEKVKGFF